MLLTHHLLINLPEQVRKASTLPSCHRTCKNVQQGKGLELQQKIAIQEGVSIMVIELESTTMIIVGTVLILLHWLCLLFCFCLESQFALPTSRLRSDYNKILLSVLFIAHLTMVSLFFSLFSNSLILVLLHCLLAVLFSLTELLYILQSGLNLRKEAGYLKSQ